MECKEIIHLLVGGNYGIFCSSACRLQRIWEFCSAGIISDDLVAIVVRTLIWGDPVAGWPWMVCVILFGVGGVQLLCIRMLGQYLSKTYLEVQTSADVYHKELQ